MKELDEARSTQTNNHLMI